VGKANAILLASAFWSIGEIEIPNHKSQTNNNDQSACGGPNLFWSLSIGI
jgi:hypothetical protein